MTDSLAAMNPIGHAAAVTGRPRAVKLRWKHRLWIKTAAAGCSDRQHRKPLAILGVAQVEKGQGRLLPRTGGCLVVVFLIIVGRGSRAQPIDGGFYSAKIDGIHILEFDQAGGPFPPDTVVTLSQDRSVQFTPLESPPNGGESKTLANVIIGGGTVPIVDIEIESHLQTVPGSSYGFAEGSLNYKFLAFRRYVWSPGTSIPVEVTMSASASASEPNARATASASMGYQTPEGTWFLEVSAQTQGTGGSEVFVEKIVSLGIAPDFTNTVSLSASTLVFASLSQTGTYSAGAIADPSIRIHPNSLVDVAGFSFPAADVYGLAFSEGFSTDTPPPNPILYVASGTQTQFEAGVPLITGARTVTKIGDGTAVLDLPNTYTGITAIQQGVLAITNAEAISSSSLVSLAGGTSFDVSGLSGGYIVSSGQTLAGSGAVLGSVTFGAGSTLSPGMASGSSGGRTPTASSQLSTHQPYPVPEPGTLGLVLAGLGLLSLGAIRGKRV
jgi:autotransporter-associated beta strand protein